MFRKRDLGVRDQEIRHKSVCFMAFATPDTLDAQDEDVRSYDQMPLVGSIKDKGSLTSASAGQRKDVQVENNVVINILRKGIAIFRINRYHSRVAWRRGEISCPCVVERQDRLW